MEYITTNKNLIKNKNIDCFKEQMKQVNSNNRIYFVDNLRVYLTFLVVLHHTAIMFGGAGSWLIRQEADLLTTIILVLFNAVNQSYFMSLFFLLSGYFVKEALIRKEMKQVLKDRFTKLGIPMIFFVIFLSPVTLLILFLDNYSISDYFINIIIHFDINFGHLWFLQALLTFLLIHLFIYRLANGKTLKLDTVHLFTKKQNVFLLIVFMSIITFIIRCFFPIGVVIANFQFAHFTHYILFYSIGVLSYNSQFFERITSESTKNYKYISLILVPILVIYLIASGALEYGLDMYMGGFSTQSFVYSIWESIACVSFSIVSINIFKNKVNFNNKITKFLSKNAYLVYIIHASIILFVGSLFITLNLPSFLKFLSVSIISLIMAYTISCLIRRSSIIKKITG